MRLRTALTAFLVFSFLIATARAAEPPRPASSTPIVRLPGIEAPSLACAAKGFACANGFSCTLNKTALGANPNPAATLLYACTPASASTSCTGVCPSGWSPVGGIAPDGSYTCKPQAALCSPAGGFPYPAGGGYYCGVVLGG